MSKAKRIPSAVKQSERSGLYVATVFGPAPYGGSISLAFTVESDAWDWVADREIKWSEPVKGK
jgi:hypothetical protein